ncbi:hypothetical protein AAC387_Pa02g0547 [Persea americana]
MKSFFFCALLILLVVSHSPPTTSQEYDDEREWDYLEDSGKGPEHWGDLNENWTICKNGTRQSPINLRDGWVDVRPLGRLQTSYSPANATLLNRGHDIMLKWVDHAGSLHIDGTDYELIQCHWHSPSEHIVNSHRLDLEVHMVHQSSDGKIAVIGVLYKIDEIFLREDPFLGELRAPLDVLVNGTVNETVAGVVDPYDLIMDGGSEYYRYMGSLTTPPCTEDVVWTVLKEPCIRPVSFDQVKKLRDAVHDYARSNARPIQQFNGRELLLSEPGPHPTTLQSI